MRIGIVGSGMIVRVILDVWKGFGERIEPCAIWCREQDLEDAKGIAADYGIEHVFTNYDAFVASDTFDVAYIGVVNSLHYEYSKRALIAGKGVVCEKPFTSTGAQAHELLELSRKKGAWLFESILPWYQRNYYATKERVAELGRMKLVQINFSQYSRRYEALLEGTVLPVFNPELDGGCIMDIMTYSIHYVMGIFGRPQAVQYFPNKAENGIDLSGVLVMDFGDFKAVLSSAKDSTSTPHCIIQGDKGYIYTHNEPGKIENVELVLNGEVPVVLDEEKLGEPFSHIWAGVLDMYENDKRDEADALAASAVEVMEVMEKARLSGGVVFPCDRQ